MKKNLTKSAYTLVEVLVTIIVLGFVIFLTYPTLKLDEVRLTALYYNAYHNISIASYNTYVEYLNNAPADAGRDMPLDPVSLCKGVANYLNTVDVRCEAAGFESTLKNGDIADTFDPKDNDHAVLASNGTRYWFSEPQKINFKLDDGADSIQNLALVFVDINGKMGPNSPKTEYLGTCNESAFWNCKVKKYPDIVAFVVTPDGMVYPIGRPEIDNKYLLTMVIYPLAKSEDSTTFSRPMSYYEAKVRAWNNKSSQSESHSYPYGSVIFEGKSSPFKITAYPQPNIDFDPPVKLDKEAGCTEGNSKCEVEFLEQ